MATILSLLFISLVVVFLCFDGIGLCSYATIVLYQELKCKQTKQFFAALNRLRSSSASFWSSSSLLTLLCCSSFRTSHLAFRSEISRSFFSTFRSYQSLSYTSPTLLVRVSFTSSAGGESWTELKMASFTFSSGFGFGGGRVDLGFDLLIRISKLRYTCPRGPPRCPERLDIPGIDFLPIPGIEPAPLLRRWGGTYLAGAFCSTVFLISASSATVGGRRG